MSLSRPFSSWSSRGRNWSLAHRVKDILWNSLQPQKPHPDLVMVMKLLLRLDFRRGSLFMIWMNLWVKRLPIPEQSFYLLSITPELHRPVSEHLLFSVDLFLASHLCYHSISIPYVSLACDHLLIHYNSVWKAHWANGVDWSGANASLFHHFNALDL